MENQRLFVAQIVVAVEHQWFAPYTSGPPIRSEKMFSIHSQLFPALDEEDAYRIASSWIERGSFSDSNHDGPGDLARIYAIGIYNIEEIVRLIDFSSKVNELYGVFLPDFVISDVGKDGMPLIRTKDNLEIFRRLRAAKQQRGPSYPLIPNP